MTRLRPNDEQMSSESELQELRVATQTATLVQLHTHRMILMSSVLIIIYINIRDLPRLLDLLSDT